MAKAPKFLFETDFDDEEDAARAVAEEILEAVEETPPEPEEEAPSFTEEDLAAAREKAFAEGKQQGTAESLNAVETKIAQTLESLGGKLDGIAASQRTAQETVRNDAAALCAALVRKLFPNLNDSQAFEDVSAMAMHVVDGLLQEPRIIIKVNESLAQPLTERLMAHLQGLGFAGDINVQGDENLGMGDCHIEWSDGSAERNMEELIDEIDAIVARNTGRGGAETPAQPASPEAVEARTPPDSAETGVAPDESPDKTHEATDIETDDETDGPQS